MRKLDNSSALNPLMYFSIFRGYLPQETGALILDMSIPRFSQSFSVILPPWSLSSAVLKYLPLSKAHKSRTNPRYTRCIKSKGTDSGIEIVARLEKGEIPFTPESTARRGLLALVSPSWIYSSGVRHGRLLISSRKDCVLC